MERKIRVAYLVSHPIQYQAPLLRYVAAQCEVDLTVFFLSDMSAKRYQDPGFGTSIQWDSFLLEGYKHVFLPTIGKRDQISFFRPFVHGLFRHLRDGGFDSLWLHGYYHQANLRALVIAKALGLKVLLRGESHLESHPTSPAKAWLKKVLLGSLFKAVDGFLAIGSLNRQFYRYYGVPDKKMFFVPYAVDNDHFCIESSLAARDSQVLKAELGLDPLRPVILYASKFMKRKRAGDVLEAYIRLQGPNGEEPNPYLLFVGEGEERAFLEQRVHQTGWTSVRFLGFKNQRELPRYYNLCDVFVLSSEYEPWGLVVNEAMSAGKPVIVSDKVGAAKDLVLDGENGFIIPVGDVRGLADRLRFVTSDAKLRERMGKRSREIIGRWGFQADYAGLLQALEAVNAQ